MALLDELPEEAASNRAETGSWGLTHELLAQLIEEVSVLAADRRRKEPRTIPRPGHDEQTGRQVGLHTTSSGGVEAVGLQGMLELASFKGQIIGAPATAAVTAAEGGVPGV